jgi:hypothetical protein
MGSSADQHQTETPLQVVRARQKLASQLDQKAIAQMPAVTESRRLVDCHQVQKVHQMRRLHHLVAMADRMHFHRFLAVKGRQRLHHLQAWMVRRTQVYCHQAQKAGRILWVHWAL